jgi:predicted nucleic acid-binding protein
LTVLVDSNVLIDLATDSAWSDWAAQQMGELEDQSFAINQLIYAETAFAYSAAEHLDRLLSQLGIARLGLPWAAAFPASRAFRAYRQRGGQRTSPLPDFYIGAHAQVAGLKLLTSDAARYRTYFPELALIAPN